MRLFCLVFLISSLDLFSIWTSLLSPICAEHILVYVATHWSVVDLPGATPSPTNHQLTVGRMLLSSAPPHPTPAISPRILTALILCGSCANSHSCKHSCKYSCTHSCKHNCFEFMIIAFLSCLEDTVSMDLRIFPSPLPQCFPSLGGYCGCLIYG